MEEKNWLVYILECLDGSYYTGITNNLTKRLDTHKSGKGSKYVLSRGFGKLILSKVYPSKSDALKVEYKVKQLPKDQKIDFLMNN
jgi:putative endonuclease